MKFKPAKVIPLALLATLFAVPSVANASSSSKGKGSQPRPSVESFVKKNQGFDKTPSTIKTVNLTKAQAHKQPTSLHIPNLNRYNLADESNARANDELKAQISELAKARREYRYPSVSVNTRDLGGYKTENGKSRVRTDRLIRSADLQHITKDGTKKLQHLHVNHIIDLRYQSGGSGIDNRPDPDEVHSKTMPKTGIRYNIDPVYSHAEDRQFHPGIKANGEIYYYGWPAVSSHQAIHAYQRVFKIALHNKHGAILYHCTLGRDRTGTTSALLLSALGVSRSDIVKDYLLTYHYEGHDHNILQRREEITHFFDTIDHDYGSVGNYLHNKLKLSNKDVSDLRSEYLEPLHADHKHTSHQSSKHSSSVKVASPKSSNRHINTYLHKVDKHAKHSRNEHNHVDHNHADHKHASHKHAKHEHADHSHNHNHAKKSELQHLSDEVRHLARKFSAEDRK